VALLAEVAAGEEGPFAVQVEIDTGMRRMGVPEEEAVAVLRDLASRPMLRLEGTYTHLACADEEDLADTRDQLARFAALLKEAAVDPGLVHWGNSAATLAGAALEAPRAPDAVRPGLALYGAQPTPVRRADLRPVMTLAAQVVHVHAVRAGQGVGYGATWRAGRDTRVATLPLGYADGIPRCVGGAPQPGRRAEVAVGGRRFPLVGRVSMDFITVDVGDAPVAVGDEARVFGAGEGTPSVEEWAVAADTLAYEMLVRVGARVPRVLEPDAPNADEGAPDAA
jgi:alanine racemase